MPPELSKKCSHYPYGNVPSWTCEDCIRNWCRVSSLSDIEKVLDYFRQEKMAIATERFQRALDTQRKLRYGKSQ